jgi:uncharacterized protein (DUF1330 family)
MNLSNQIHPTREQFNDLVQNHPKDEPVVMINILRFKEKTGNGAETGVEAYERYGQNVIPFLKKVGGKLIWRGRVNNTLIGDSNGQPHIVLLVEYPSIQKFIEMSTDPEYLKITKDRTISLEYGGLMASTTEYKGS